MNYGRFFEFDFESSYLQKGIAVFNYRWLKRQDISDKKMPRYPVYLTFTPESFSFNLHYLKDANKDKPKENDSWSHYHNTIIEVRLSPNVDVAKGLNESLNNAYDTEFPLKARENKCVVINTVDDELLDIIKNSFDLQDCSVSGYSSLECFEPETKDDYDKNKDDSPHLLRKIVLDFLFDYEFSNVFKNIAFYDELSAKLKENFLFNALMCKTRYYYYRTELSKREAVERCLFVGEGKKEMEKCDRDLKFFFEQYAKAEYDWVGCILDDRAMQVFHESPWFEEAHKELEQVYFANRQDKWIPKNKNNKRHIKSVKPVGAIENVKAVNKVPSVNKIVRKRVARIKYINSIDANKDSFKLTVSNMLNLVRKKSPELLSAKKTGTFGKAVKLHGDTAKKAAVWNVSHYHFTGLWKLWFGDVSTRIWSIAVTLSVLVIIWLWFFNMYDYDKWFDTEKFTVVTHAPRHIWSFIIAIPVLIGVMVMIGWIIRRHFRSTWGEGCMAMLMPRLLAAVTTAWLTIAMSVDAIQVFVTEDHLHWPAIIILFSMTYLFVIYEARQKNPFDKWKDYLQSSFIVIVIAYIYSLIVGYMAFDFFGEATITNLLNDKTALGKGGEPHRGIFVLQFSCFATFIGIFLQLMFQGKSVTETK